MLLSTGASVGAGGKEGITPLHFAAGNGHAEVVRRLLDTSAVPGHRLNTSGESPLHVAAGAGHVEVVKLILPRMTYRQINTASSGIHGTTPLVRAVDGQHADVVKTVSVPFQMSEASEKLKSRWANAKHQLTVCLPPSCQVDVEADNAGLKCTGTWPIQ